MRVAVTGTPGTGKSTATERLEAERRDADRPDADRPDADRLDADRLNTDLDVVHLNDVVREREDELTTGVDDDRDSLITDVDAVEEWLSGREDVLVESHLAHHLDVDRVVVLRAHPETIVDRLTERGESEAKAEENAESEALDVILTEAVETHGLDAVYEIDTTERSPDEVAAEIEAVIANEREPSAGTVTYLEWL